MQRREDFGDLPGSCLKGGCLVEARDARIAAGSDVGGIHPGAELNGVNEFPCACPWADQEPDGFARRCQQHGDARGAEVT